ncbi:MAG: hypothetical protein FJ385_01265 [Verrucomicrobia bacterium]|nr:hypothetical protein [Verrucomicrobiota bacterium]
MKSRLPFLLAALLPIGVASGQTLYYTGADPHESSPLRWSAGTTLMYDDNINSGYTGAGGGAALDGQDSFAIGPYLGLTYSSMDPQTTWDIGARLGALYYMDEPATNTNTGSQNNNDSRLMLSLNHRFSERVQLRSNNYFSYSLMPDFETGIPTAVNRGDTIAWSTANSLGYRWTERFGTYTGFKLRGTSYTEDADQDQFTWEVNNEFRYQVSPTTVLIGDYRYGETTGDQENQDSTDHYILGGVERRFSQTTAGNFRAGVQIRQRDRAGRPGDTNDDLVSPYTELALTTRPIQALSLRSFLRYGIESNDLGQTLTNGTAVSYGDRRTMRIGVSSTYTLSPTLSLKGGIDYVPTSFEDGVLTGPGGGAAPDGDEQLINLSLGLTAKFTEFIYGTLTYTYTNADSDFRGTNYDRNRISIGISAEF